MLTKTDLQRIGEIIDSKLDAKLNSVLDIKLKPIKKDINYIRKTVNLIIKDYDERDVALRKRVDRIEEHLQI